MKIKEIIPEYNSIKNKQISFYDGLSHSAFNIENVMSLAKKLYGEDYIKNEENSNNNPAEANSASKWSPDK